jgi:hypothetical protein
MYSTCFEPKSPNSGRQLYKQLWYGTFYIHRYKQFSPEDETSSSKQVEDIKIKNQNINLQNVHFSDLSSINTLYEYYKARYKNNIKNN